MIIAQTPPRFYPYIGGVENYCLDLSKTLVKRGHKVKVFCADEGGKKVSRVGEIRVFRHKTLFKIANTNVTKDFVKTLREQDYDLMHTYQPTPFTCDLSVREAKKKGKPSVISYCNDIVGNSPLTRLAARVYNKFVLRKTLKACDRIVVINPYYAEISLYLKDFKEKIVFIPVGVDEKRFVNKKKKKQGMNIGFLSLLDESHGYKGLNVLLEAMKTVVEKIPRAKLFVGGKGKLMPRYKEMCESLGIEKNVVFKGFIPEKELVNFYNSLDVFVLPTISSKQEGFGIVLIEALLCGTDVITTEKVGMQAFLKENSLGSVIQSGNSELLAKTIIERLNKHSRIKRDLLIKNFGNLAVAKKFEKLYEELL